MTDYISREAAIYALMQAEPIEHDGEQFNLYPPNHATLIERIKNLSAADVRTIIYCRDCKHTEESLVNGCVYCNEMERVRINEGWCAWGEAREEQT